MVSHVVQVRLYPEEIVSYDVAEAQQSPNAEVHRATLFHTTAEIAGNMAALSKTVAELQSAQRSHGEALERLSDRQTELLLEVRHALTAMQAPADGMVGACGASAAAPGTCLRPTVAQGASTRASDTPEKSGPQASAENDAALPRTPEWRPPPALPPRH